MKELFEAVRAGYTARVEALVAADPTLRDYRARGCWAIPPSWKRC